MRGKLFTYDRASEVYFSRGLTLTYPAEEVSDPPDPWKSHFGDGYFCAI